MKELIKEAKKRVDEIVSKSKEDHPRSYLAIYESENGYTVSHIKIGMETRTPLIAFGKRPLTKDLVEQIIAAEEARFASVSMRK